MAPSYGVSIPSSILETVLSRSVWAATPGDTAPRQQFISKRTILHLTRISNPMVCLGRIHSVKMWGVHSVQHLPGS